MFVKALILILAAIACLLIAWFIYSFVDQSLVVFFSLFALLVGVVIGKVLW